jgi:tellurite resistance protein
MTIAKLLPPRPISSAKEAAQVLELAFLMAAADGELHDAERRAYREIVEGLRAKPISDAHFEALITKFSAHVGKSQTEIAERVRKVAHGVAAPLRDTAFKLALGIALVDYDDTAEEEALVDAYVEALGLTLPHAQALAAEVRGAFGFD